MTVGWVNVGDVNSGNGALTVGGQLTSATKSSGGNASRIRVYFPNQGGTNYVPMISFYSLGTPGNDNDIEQPVIEYMNSTYFEVYLYEIRSTQQNLRMFVSLMKY